MMLLLTETMERLMVLHDTDTPKQNCVSSAATIMFMNLQNVEIQPKSKCVLGIV